MPRGFLARILPHPEDKFYQYFEEGAEVCELSAQLFEQIVRDDPDQLERYLEPMQNYKIRARAIMDNCLVLVNNSFITPIDPEDIQMIATRLYRSTKGILKACVNLRIYKLDAYDQVIRDQADLLSKAAEGLRAIVATLRNGVPMNEVAAASSKLKDIESAGDDILSLATEKLFSGKYEALHALKLRGIYKGVENALDICSGIADLIVNISLKHN